MADSISTGPEGGFLWRGSEGQTSGERLSVESFMCQCGGDTV